MVDAVALRLLICEQFSVISDTVYCSGKVYSRRRPLLSPVLLGRVSICTFIVISDVDEDIALRRSKVGSLSSFWTCCT